MDISELEFVQIIIILLAMTFMIVLIICLLSHYRLPALAFLSRLSTSHRTHATQMVMCGHLNTNRTPLTQQQLCRFQPTYLQQEIINLPPIICLSDGEELLPYKGPCTLQLRHPDQQLELIRAAVRAPPNRTVFDVDFIDVYVHSKSLQAPSRNSGANDARARTEGPPPSYSEVMGSTVAPPTDNRSASDRAQTLLNAHSCESTTKTSRDLNKNS